MTDPCSSLKPLSRTLDLIEGIIIIPSCVLWLGVFLSFSLSILLFWIGQCSRPSSQKGGRYDRYSAALMNIVAPIRGRVGKAFPLLTYCLLYLSLASFFAFIYNLSYQNDPRTFSFKPGTSSYEQFLMAECSRRLIWNVEQSNQITAYTAWLINKHGGSQKILTFVNELPDNKLGGVYLRTLAAISLFKDADKEWSSEQWERFFRMIGQPPQETKGFFEAREKLSKKDPDFLKRIRIELPAFSFLEADLERDLVILKRLMENAFGSFKKESLSDLREQTNFDTNMARIGIENLLLKGFMIEKKLLIEGLQIDPWRTIDAVRIREVRYEAIYSLETHNICLFPKFWLISLYGFIDKLPVIEIDPKPQSKIIILITLLNWLLNGVIIWRIISNYRKNSNS